MPNTAGDSHAITWRDKRGGRGWAGWRRAGGSVSDFQGNSGQMDVCPTPSEVPGPTPAERGGAYREPLRITTIL